VVVGADDSGALVGPVVGSLVGSVDADVDEGIKTELRTSPREGRIPSAVVVGAELSVVVVGAELSTPVDPADPLNETPLLESLSGVGVALGDELESVKIPPGPNVIPLAAVVVVESVDSDSDESVDVLGVG